MINIGSKVQALLGKYSGEIGIVTTIITTTRKRFYVTFESGEIGCYFYRNLKLVKDISPPPLTAVEAIKI